MSSGSIVVKIWRKHKMTTYQLRKGLGLQALCARNETGIEYDCRKADCGICVIKIKNGQQNISEKTSAEADFLTAMRADDDERLACQLRMFGDVELETDYLDED